MRRLWMGYWLAVAFLIAVHPAVGWAFDSDVTCPADVTSGAEITAFLRLENDECTQAEVRLISSIVGNADQTLGGIGIQGPTVVESAITVPAGIDNFPPGCFDVTPGIFQDIVTISPAVPISLEGTVATLIVITEWRIGGQKETTEVIQCLVNVQP